MRRLAVAPAAAVLTAAGAAGGARAAQAPAGKPQAMCPVTGRPFERKTSPHVDRQGQRVYVADAAERLT